MNNEYTFNIDDTLIDVFSSNPLIEIINKYHIKKYYELNQLHSNIVNIINDDCNHNLNGDAMITNLKNVALVIKTADCIPIVLYDNKTKILAVIHSGWKGTLNGIVKEVLNKMLTTYNVDIKNIKAYLYPSIRKCHFEVEKDVYNMFKNKIKNIDKYTNKNGIKYYIDLQNIVINDLKECGITNIYDANICTYCQHDKYYSYRYNNTNKRNYLITLIKE